MSLHGVIGHYVGQQTINILIQFLVIDNVVMGVKLGGTVIGAIAEIHTHG